MTQEQIALVAILAGKEYPSNVDWQRIYELSMMQGVAGICLDALANSSSPLVIPQQLKLKWIGLQLKIEHQNLQHNQVLYKVITLLTMNEVSVVLLKGQGLAMEYEHPLHRICGDIDLYVGTKGYDLARKLFAAQGWLAEGTYHEDVKHLGFSVDNVMIELHRYSALIPGRARNHYFQQWIGEMVEHADCGLYVSAEGAVSASALEDGVLVRTMPMIENTVFTFVHLFGHFVSHGVTLRQVMDWMMLMRRLCSRGIDPLLLERQLKKIGYLKAWQNFSCLLVRYFGFTQKEIPGYHANYEKHSERILKLIYEDGEKNNLIVSHADGLKQKSAVLWKSLSDLSRTFRLFPSETLLIFFRWLQNVSLKYRLKLLDKALSKKEFL